MSQEEWWAFAETLVLRVRGMDDAEGRVREILLSVLVVEKIHERLQAPSGVEALVEGIIPTIRPHADDGWIADFKRRVETSAKEVADQWMELGTEVEEILKGCETNADLVRASRVLSGNTG
jgi:hypothetical protein